MKPGVYRVVYTPHSNTHIIVTGDKYCIAHKVDGQWRNKFPSIWRGIEKLNQANDYEFVEDLLDG